MQALLADMGIQVDVEVLTDASAAMGVLDRRGLGRLRHVDTNFLWVQEAAADTNVKYQKTKGVDNFSDLLTKHVPRELIEKFTSGVGIELTTDESKFGYKAVSIVEKEEIKSWMRVDNGSVSLRGSAKTGPRNEDIRRRETYDLNTGEMIWQEDEASMNKNGFWEHRCWSEPTDTLTIFYFVPRSLSCKGVRARNQSGEPI